MPMPRVTANNLWQAIHHNVAWKKSLGVTDESAAYGALGLDHHATVNHRSGEYVRGAIHTNTVEGFFSTLKRGIAGVYHHISDGPEPRRWSAWPKASASPSTNQQALATGTEREKFRECSRFKQLKLGL
jgi:hypothetical protein